MLRVKKTCDSDYFRIVLKDFGQYTSSVIKRRILLSHMTRGLHLNSPVALGLHLS